MHENTQKSCKNTWKYTKMHENTQKYMKIHKNAWKSKYSYESTLYLSDFDDFGVVGKLRPSAFQRHQARKNPVSIRLIHGHVLIRNFRVFIKFVKNPHFLSTKMARKDKNPSTDLWLQPANHGRDPLRFQIRKFLFAILE